MFVWHASSEETTNGDIIIDIANGFVMEVTTI